MTQQKEMKSMQHNAELRWRIPTIFFLVLPKRRLYQVDETLYSQVGVLVKWEEQDTVVDLQDVTVTQPQVQQVLQKGEMIRR